MTKNRTAQVKDDPNFIEFTREQWSVGTILILYLILIFAFKLRPSGVSRLLNRLLKRNKEDSIRVDGEILANAARLRHTHIVGATGSGKTVLLEKLLIEDIKRGHGCLIVDPKGDRELFERVKWECSKHARANDLQLFSSTHLAESYWWNPCGLGNASELQSKFYNSAIYSEPHYAKWCEKILLEVFTKLTSNRPTGFTIHNAIQEVGNLANSGSGKNEKVEGLFLDLFNLANGEWAPLFDRNPKKSEINFLNLTQNSQILFVDLPTESKKVQSSRIGRLLTQELMLVSGLRKVFPSLRTDKPFSVYIDEFDAFATESFATFLNKARSSSFMIHIAHQTLSDLNRISPDFSGQILGNCNVRFIFRQDDPDDAERWSRFIGTKKSTKRTYQTQNGSSTGMSSNRDVQEFIVTPDQIKNLKIGEYVLSVKTDQLTRLVKSRFSISDMETPAANSSDGPMMRGTGARSNSIEELNPVGIRTEASPQKDAASVDAWHIAGISN
ncbi:MAG: type IV secretory system conjugative DNA transfer family protein [Bacteriovoracia bacterium]